MSGGDEASKTGDEILKVLSHSVKADSLSFSSDRDRQFSKSGDQRDLTVKEKAFRFEIIGIDSLIVGIM